MKAMIFAAGLGTRLRPITDKIPKALVNVANKPMLEHVIIKLKQSGVTDIVINIHHLGEQIIDFLNKNNNFGINIEISNERDMLLDTGGGIKKAKELLLKSYKGDNIHSNNESFLVHNVDILSNCNLKELFNTHKNSRNNLATMLVSNRITSRYLLFNNENKLCGWVNKKTKETKPKGFIYKEGEYKEYAFSGIQVISPDIFKLMDNKWNGKFSIIDFYLSICNEYNIICYPVKDLKILDIGKPETLSEAENFIKENVIA